MKQLVDDTHNDITRIMMSWRNAVEMGQDGWAPLPVSDLQVGDTVFGHLEEERDGVVSRVVMYVQPFTITAIDDTFWQTARPGRRILKHGRGTVGETHIDRYTQLIVVKGE